MGEVVNGAGATWYDNLERDRADRGRRKAQQQSFCELMLAAKLGRSFSAALDLAAQVELELPCKGARGFGRHNLLRSGSVPAGVDSTQWYGRRGSLQGAIFYPSEVLCWPCRAHPKNVFQALDFA